ncbi:MAG TPA: septum formation initiator family protein [Rhodospirillales bacterium]|jgi:cell division protein FtsB|nr:septum formation initiator family protein [Rhodospirillales bacterium]
MSLLLEFRSRARFVIGPILGFCAIGYFVYHAFHGDRGFFAWRLLHQQVEEARQVYAATHARREVLTHRVKLLSPASLDPDMLEERARDMLNYGFPDDVVILDD